MLHDLIVGWGKRVIKEGAGILHQISRFRGDVNSWGSRIHQSKSWYYLGPFQTSKVELFAKILFGCKLFPFFCEKLRFAKIVFGYKSFPFFCKSSDLDVSLFNEFQ